MKISSNLGAMLDQDNVLQITCIQHLDGGRALVKIGPEIDIKFFSCLFYSFISFKDVDSVNNRDKKRGQCRTIIQR